MRGNVRLEIYTGKKKERKLLITKDVREIFRIKARSYPMWFVLQ